MRSTTQKFVEKAITIHGDKYCYSSVSYFSAHEKVSIICKIHGIFLQRPNDHLNGSGCPKCKNIISSKCHKSSLEQFIEKSKLIHGGKYDYNNFIYKDSQTKGIIKCKINDHGNYWMTPNNHLRNHGCPKCKAEKSSLILCSTVEKFIEKARVIHGDKYDYSKFTYINNFTKSTITCLIHGEFKQSPNSHLSHNGCPKCNSPIGELILEEIFKKHKIKNKPQYNIPEIVANYKVDFYLPEYRCLVEFHGIQHYEYIPFFHDGDYTFEDQKTRDELVRDAAIRWKYNYLEFNYKQLKYLSKDQFEALVIEKINKYKKQF